MTKRERLETVFRGGVPDRTPTFGGNIACPDHICTLADISLEEYWYDPISASIKAYKVLDIDGLLGIFVPVEKGGYRNITADTYKKAEGLLSFDETLNAIDALPEPEQIESDFNFNESYELFKQNITETQKMCGDIFFMPAQWDAGARARWYEDYGYENFFMVVGMYPDKARKLFEVGGARGRCLGNVIAKAVTEGIFPHAVQFGEDICTQRGPMISPEFLEKYYAPMLRYAIEPLREVGCKSVWHSDGDIRQIMDMLINCGIEGFQGFQQECGLTIEYVASKRTKEGKPLLIFGPIAVTTELPVCTPDEIKTKVKHAIDVCKGNADIVIHTSNTINPDVPLENIIAMYEAARG